jgi:hypothetical protein
LNRFLIHAEPGARAGFVAAWLLDSLAQAGFDVGATVNLDYVKEHSPNFDEITNFIGRRIRIQTTFDRLDLQLLLFLRKNVHVQIPDFTRDEFSIDTFSKVYIFAQECFEFENAIDYSLYNHIIKFEDTFNLKKITELYQAFHGRDPSLNNCNQALENNRINLIDLDPNHACSVAAMVLETEARLNLKEKNRLWSLPEIYATVPTTELYQTIKSKIITTNYGLD